MALPGHRIDRLVTLAQAQSRAQGFQQLPQQLLDRWERSADAWFDRTDHAMTRASLIHCAASGVSPNTVGLVALRGTFAVAKPGVVNLATGMREVVDVFIGGLRFADRLPIMWEHSGRSIGSITHAKLDPTKRCIDLYGRVDDPDAVENLLYAGGKLPAPSWAGDSATVVDAKHPEVVRHLNTSIAEVSFVAAPAALGARSEWVKSIPTDAVPIGELARALNPATAPAAAAPTPPPGARAASVTGEHHRPVTGWVRFR